MKLNKHIIKYAKILNQPSIKHDVNLQLACTNQPQNYGKWQNKQSDKLCSRAASVLISVFYVMRKLGIENPEECLTHKLKELK